VKNLLFILAILFISIETEANSTFHRYPTVAVKDAMGTTEYSIRNFCLSHDEKTLEATLRVCPSASYSERGRLECDIEPTLEMVEIENLFTRTVRGPRGSQRTYKWSFGREVSVDIIELRSGQKIGEFTYRIPKC
jgi:hypothetical protein